MKRLLYAAMLLLGLSIIVGCSKETDLKPEPKPDPDEKATLTVAPTSLTFENSGGAQSISITTNKAWTISSSQSWCKVSQSSGIARGSSPIDISIICDKNTTYDDRTCALTISGETSSQTVEVKQDGKIGIFVEHSAYSASAEEQTLEIKVKSNIDYAITIDPSCSDWISHIGTKDLPETVVSLRIAQNTGGTRIGKVIIVNNAIVIDEVSIVQDGFPPKNNQIYYNSTHGAIIEPTYPDFGDAAIVSNEYVKGTGIISFDRDLTSISLHAFYGCSSLASIVIPEGVTSIGENAFCECSKLISINIPEGVTSIEEGTFYGCSSLASIVIPEGVTSIGYRAFAGCSSLTSINIPEGVTSIGNNAFSGCSSLTSINIPEGVTSIGNNAFSGCSSLTSINIPEGVTSIEEGTFYGCSSLASIVIPEGVTSIGYSAFVFCHSLTEVYCRPFTPPSLPSWGACFDPIIDLTIYVPMESVVADRLKWSDYADQIQGYEF